MQDERMSSQTATTSHHIVIVRHAKSSWDDDSLTDIDRPLSKRGRNALPLVNAHIAGLGLSVDLVISSPSVRTRATLDGIRAALGDATITLDRNVYEATGDQLIDILRAVEETVPTVLLVGHNPGVSELVDDLVDDAAASARIGKFPTGALALLSTRGPWRELGPGSATLVDFWTPRPAR
jgi:phosphohistidine phosphatase